MAARTLRPAPLWARGAGAGAISTPGPRGDPRGPTPALSVSLHTQPGAGAYRRVRIPFPFLRESCLDFCYRDAHLGGLEVLSSLPKFWARVTPHELTGP